MKKNKKVIDVNRIHTLYQLFNEPYDGLCALEVQRHVTALQQIERELRQDFKHYREFQPFMEGWLKKNPYKYE